MGKKTWCPHCGNSDTQFREENNTHPRDPMFRYLCTKRVPPEESSFDRDLIEPDQIGDDGLTLCGMQWEPNDPDYMEWQCECGAINHDLPQTGGHYQCHRCEKKIPEQDIYLYTRD